MNNGPVPGLKEFEKFEREALRPTLLKTIKALLPESRATRRAWQQLDDPTFRGQHDLDFLARMETSLGPRRRPNHALPTQPRGERIKGWFRERRNERMLWILLDSPEFTSQLVPGLEEQLRQTLYSMLRRRP